MDEPTPEEAADALRTVQESRQRVIRSVLGSRWTSIAAALLVVGYTVAIDLVPATVPWLTWVLVGVAIALVLSLRSRIGGSLLGRPVTASRRSLPVAYRSRLLTVVPVVVGSVAVAVVVSLVRLPHAVIWYGVLAAIYLVVLGPRLQLWLLRRQDEG
jgi:hypothetical protein